MEGRGGGAEGGGQEETIIDERLRQFFSKVQTTTNINHQFSIAEKVIDSFLGNNGHDNNDNGNDHDKAPILIRYNVEQVQQEGEGKSKNNLQMNQEENYYDELFNPLFAKRINYQPQISQKAESIPEQDVPVVNQKRKGQSFKITVAYKGSSFCGWQIQPQNEVPSVQQTLIDILNPILLVPVPEPLPEPVVYNNNDDNIDDQNSKKTKNKKKYKNKPIDIRVCGRTDAGVSAIAQVCRVRTLRSAEDVTANDIQNRINNKWDQDQLLKTSIIDIDKEDYEEYGKDEHTNPFASGRSLYCTSVERVNDKFHPTFGAKSRAYAYIIDSMSLTELINDIPNNGMMPNDAAQDISKKNISIEKIVYVLNQMTKRIEGLELDYIGLSYGKVKTSTTLCTLLRARVSLVKLNDNNNNDNEVSAVCFEFVADRFLRRMIRIMISTLLNLTIQCLVNGSNSNDKNFENAFLDLIQCCDRKMSSKPASSDGLLFVGATFED